MYLNNLQSPFLKKVAHTQLPNVGFCSWSWFLAVSLQVMWVINPVVGCHYFPPGMQLPRQPLRGLLLLPILHLVNTGTMVWTVCLRLLPDSNVSAIWTRAFLRLSPARLPSHPGPFLDAKYFCINFCHLFSATCLTDWQLNNCIHSAIVSRDFTQNILLQQLPTAKSRKSMWALFSGKTSIIHKYYATLLNFTRTCFTASDSW